MEYLADLIPRKSTDFPRELAEKLGVSEGTIYDLITLRDLDGPICYGLGSGRTYYFGKEGAFILVSKRRNNFLTEIILQ
jgi:transposase